MTDVRVRDISSSDIDRLVELNNAEVPAVGELDPARLRRLVELAEAAVVSEVAGAIGGFALALPPGTDYASPNYRWFADRYDDFTYLDRIAIAPTYQRRRLGHLLYEEVERRTDAAWFCCEVNIRPRNEPSLRFHERRGFEPVGEQDTDGGAKRVVLLAKRLD